MKKKRKRIFKFHFANRTCSGFMFVVTFALAMAYGVTKPLSIRTTSRSRTRLSLS